MKTLKTWLLAFPVLLALATTGCKKDEETPGDTTQVKSTSDEALVTGEVDDLMGDANTLFYSSSVGGRTERYTVPCDATIDSTFGDKSATLTFNGSNCLGTGKTRTGNVTFSLNGTTWSTAGAVLTITFNNYKVTRTINGSATSIVINGSHKVTNTSGGNFATVSTTAPLVHKVRGSINVAFDNGTARSWKAARVRTFTSTTNVSLAGDTAFRGESNVSVIGENRYGSTYYAVISSPIQSNATCGWFKPTAGVKVHKGFGPDVTTTYGVDASGNAVSSACAGYFKISWTNVRGTSRTVIAQY